jgi:hypothetical protein
MDKIALYKKYILSILERLRGSNVANTNLNIETQIVTDTTHHHYHLLRTGFDKDMVHIYSIVLHFQIKEDGKIWILNNRTDIDVAEELQEMGVPKTDIVLGFQAPLFRSYSGYAVA